MHILDNSTWHFRFWNS